MHGRGIAVQRYGVEIAVDDEVEERRPVALDDRVRLLGAPLAGFALDEARDLVVDAKFDAGVGRMRRKRRPQRTGEPATSRSSSGFGGPTDRAPQCAST